MGFLDKIVKGVGKAFSNVHGSITKAVAKKAFGAKKGKERADKILNTPIAALGGKTFKESVAEDSASFLKSAIKTTATLTGGHLATKILPGPPPSKLVAPKTENMGFLQDVISKGSDFVKKLGGTSGLLQSILPKSQEQKINADVNSTKLAAAQALFSGNIGINATGQGGTQSPETPWYKQIPMWAWFLIVPVVLLVLFMFFKLLAKIFK